MNDQRASSSCVIEPMAAPDAGAVLAIYQAGLDTGQASFETQAPEWAAFDAARLADHRYVARDRSTGEVLGWVAVSAVSSRCVYAGVVEHSVYVASGARGRGVGPGGLAVGGGGLGLVGLVIYLLIALLSNGSFGGIHARLLGALAARRPA